VAIAHSAFAWKDAGGEPRKSQACVLASRLLVEICSRILKYCPLMSQYIFSIMMFIIKHTHQFTVNSEIHGVNTRQHSNLHQPAPNLTGFKHGIYCSGVKIYNNLPLHIKQLADDPRTFELKFKKKNVYFHSHYSLVSAVMNLRVP